MKNHDFMRIVFVAFSLPFVIIIGGLVISSTFAQAPAPPPVIATSSPTVITGSVTANQGTPAANANSWPVGSQPYPNGAVPLATSSGVVANTTATATLAAVSGKTTYITGFDISADGATTGSCVVPTVGLLIGGGNFSYLFCFPSSASASGSVYVVNFSPPVPASAVNTSISVSLPALGTGNTGAVVNVRGFQL